MDAPYAIWLCLAKLFCSSDGHRHIYRPGVRIDNSLGSEVLYKHKPVIICLDPYIQNSFNYLDPISINVCQCITSLLNLEITVSFLAFIASSFRVTEED